MQLQLSIDCPNEALAWTDEILLEPIVFNLISNAVKYADLRKADPFLEVSIVANAKQAEIRIRDNGEGIPAESVTKIFDMFFRASRRGTGSGLGVVHREGSYSKDKRCNRS